MSGIFGGGSKPKTPESEKIATRFQSAMGREGTQLVSRVGDKFVSNVKRDRQTSVRSAASADVAVAQRAANQKAGADITKVVKTASGVSSVTAANMVAAETTAVTDTASRKQNSNASAMDFSGKLTGNLLRIGRQESARSIDKMNREFARANQLVDIVGLAGAAYVGGAFDSAGESVAAGSMSTTSASGAQMSSVVNPTDVLSNPLPPISF